LPCNEENSISPRKYPEVGPPEFQELVITSQVSRTNMTEFSRDVIHLDAITRFCYTYIQHLSGI